MSMTMLPRLSNLPQWQRVKTLDRARYPRRFSKDSKSSSSMHSDCDSMVSDTRSMDPCLRLEQMERNMEFLKRQHKELLFSLHQEIDQLKRENKEYKFRSVTSASRTNFKNGSSVMIASISPIKPEDTNGSSSQDAADTQMSESLAANLPDDLEKLCCDDEVISATIQASQSNVLPSITPGKRSPETRRPSPDQGDQFAPVHAVSINPLLVRRPGDDKPRSPTLYECRTIIRQLQEQSDKQSLELLKMKSDLKDVLNSQQWTPDTYLIAKGYVMDHENSGSEQNRAKFSLPPLPQTMGNKASDRQKRIEAVKKARQQHKDGQL